jgi:DNA-binding ferritin-like protein
MAHKIFLLHGMGKHDDDWAKAYVEKLETLWSSYSDLATHFPLTGFLFIPIRYDSIFELQRKKLGTHNDKVIERMDGFGGFPSAALAKLTSKLTGNAFLATHVLDVLLFYHLATFKESVATHVVNAINQHFDAGEAREFSVIAHSLGTAVIQQALQAWADNQQKNPWPVKFQVFSLLQVSNVSRLLEIGGHHDAYESIVRPADQRSQGACQYYLNARNKLDPIWKPKEFAPLDVWKYGLSESDRYIECEFKHLASRNPHELMDYLAHPAVHVPFFRSLTSPDAISDTVFEARKRDFAGKISDELMMLASDYGELKDDDTLGSLFELMAKVDFLTGK